MTSSPLPPEEAEQLLQHIEMFEAHAKSNPHDCTSLQILKDAHWKLGNQREALALMRQLADAYMSQNQYGAALLEYEALLLRTPEDPELQLLAAEAKNKLSQPAIPASAYTLEITEDELAATPSAALPSDGNDALSQFFIQNGIAPEPIVAASLSKVRQINETLGDQQPVCSLVEQLAIDAHLPLEQLLAGLLDKLKCPYIPLEFYDVDWQVVRLLPTHLSLGRLIVPFDLLSRTVMIATANPLDQLAQKSVEELLDYQIVWHLASPTAIAQLLRSTYHLPPPSAQP